MERLILLTSLVRVSLVLGFFLVNLLSVLRLLHHTVLKGVGGGRLTSPSVTAPLCNHLISTGFILVACSVYLASWLPYLFGVFVPDLWPFFQANHHCILQHLVTNQVTTVLLALLVVRKLYDAFSASRARTLAFAACIAWIIPQLMYLTAADLLNRDQRTFRFMDRVMLVPSSATESPRNGSRGMIRTDDTTASVGFAICVQHLASPVVAQLAWHYVVLVIPLTALILLCFAVHYLKTSFNAIDSIQSCKCSDDLLVTLSLYFNMMWLLILRPLIVLQTLMMSLKSDDGYFSTRSSVFWEEPPTYLDFGTHLVLMFAAVFVPFSGQGGFRTDFRRLRPPSSLKAPEPSPDYDRGSLVDEHIHGVINLGHFHSHDTDSIDNNQPKYGQITKNHYYFATKTKEEHDKSLPPPTPFKDPIGHGGRRSRLSVGSESTAPELPPRTPLALIDDNSNEIEIEDEGAEYVNYDKILKETQREEQVETFVNPCVELEEGRSSKTSISRKREDDRPASTIGSQHEKRSLRSSSSAGYQQDNDTHEPIVIAVPTMVLPDTHHDNGVIESKASHRNPESRPD